MTLQKNSAIGSLSVVIEQDAPMLAKHLAGDLAQQVRDYVNAGNEVILLCSGGSALYILEFLDPRIAGPHLTIAPLDERFDQTNASSNARALQDTPFVHKALEVGSTLIDTSTAPDDTQGSLGDRFERSLRDWRRNHPEGKIVAIAGVGSDAHTAGMMPFPEDPTEFSRLFESDHWVCAYDAGNKNIHRNRATTTISFMKKIDRVYVYVNGIAKAPALESMIKADSPAVAPAHILTTLPGVLYIDEPLAQVLHV